MRHKRHKWVPAAEKLAQAYAHLEKIRATIQEFPKVLEKRNKKLADIKPLLDSVQKKYHHKRVKIYAEWERKKAAIIEAAKNRQWVLMRWLGDDPLTKEVKQEIENMRVAMFSKVWEEQRGEEMKIIATKEKEQKIEDLFCETKHWEEDDKYSFGKMAIFAYYGVRYNYDGKNEPPPIFRGYAFSEYGLAEAKRDENKTLQAIDLLKKMAARETEEGKLRIKYGIGDDVFAAAAAHFGTTRQLAEKIKGALEGQLAVTKDCPYCGLPLGDAMHADHIYPVSKGGLSTIENMILICDQCNLKKGSKTLRQFIAAYKLDGKRIESVLESLRKHF